MSTLKTHLIRLGSTNPELRKHIRPVLDRISSRPWYQNTIGNYHIEASDRRWGVQFLITDVEDSRNEVEVDYVSNMARNEPFYEVFFRDGSRRVKIMETRESDAVAHLERLLKIRDSHFLKMLSF